MASLPPIVALIEDQPEYRAPIRTQIELVCPGVHVEEITSESEFYEFLESDAWGQVRVAIFDMLLPWAWPSPDMPEPPDDVAAEGFKRAGWRCYCRAKAKEETSTRRTLLIYSIFTAEEVEVMDSQGVSWLTKTPDHQALANAVKGGIFY